MVKEDLPKLLEDPGLLLGILLTIVEPVHAEVDKVALWVFATFFLGGLDISSGKLGLLIEDNPEGPWVFLSGLDSGVESATGIGLNAGMGLIFEPSFFCKINK